MIKTNLFFKFDAFEQGSYNFKNAIEKGFLESTIKIETDIDINLGINEMFYPIEYIQNLSLSDFYEIITFTKSEITQDFFDSVCEAIENDAFYVSSVYYNLTASKSIVREIWFNTSPDNK